jgi:G3E family GTPase
MVTEHPARLPVTVITGFLGAGKTTLVAQLVKQAKTKRIAVIQNEVSEEMGIESAVLTDSSGNIIPDFFELPNGCVCCSAKGDMILALENIVNLGRERIDAIVVETTGIADPCAVVELFWVDSEMGSSVVLDGVIAVVDCVNFPNLLSESHNLGHADVGRRQIAVADRVLINKTDLVDPDAVGRVRQLVETLNPTADIAETRNSMIDADWVLNIESFSSDRVINTVEHASHDASTVDHVFLTFSNRSFKKSNVELCIGELLWEAEIQEKFGFVYRVKGIFKCSETGVWQMLQGVGALFEITPLPEAELLYSNKSGSAKFLLIGSELDKEGLRAKLNNIS